MEKIVPISPFGRERLFSNRPFRSETALRDEFNRIEIVRCLPDSTIFLLCQNLAHYKDIRNSIKRCGKGNVLSITELYEIKLLCIYFSEMLQAIGDIIDKLKVRIHTLDEPLLILDPMGQRELTFYVDNSLYNGIDDLRQKKSIIDAKMKKAENIEIPRLKYLREKLVANEQYIENKVCKELSNKLKKYSKWLLDNCLFLGMLDLLICKCKLLEQKAVIPQIVDGGKIVCVDMINIEIAEFLASKGKKFTPITVELGYGATLITGSNMGGKSVALKTLGLNTMLAMYGWPVFAKKMEVPLISEIVYIGASVNPNINGLSSFGAEMIEMIQMTQNLKKDTLIILDEPAKGTNPREGAAIVKGFTEFLNKRNSYTIIATHYDGVDKYANMHYQTHGLSTIEKYKKEVITVEGFDIDIFNKYMEYGIFPCEKNSTPQDAIRVCQFLGLDSDILTSIMSFLE